MTTDLLSLDGAAKPTAGREIRGQSAGGFARREEKQGAGGVERA